MKKYKPLEVDDASPCMKCGSVQCAFCSDDVLSAIKGLISDFSPPNVYGGRGPFFTRDDAVRFINKWFPSLKEK
jgi:hypothetical protein